MQDRRFFLQKAADVASGMLFKRAILPMVESSHAPDLAVHTLDEAHWQSVKKQFGMRDGALMLHAASLFASPLVVRATLQEYSNDVESDVSFQTGDNSRLFGKRRSTSSVRMSAAMAQKLLLPGIRVKEIISWCKALSDGAAMRC